MRLLWPLHLLLFIGCSSPDFKVAPFHLRDESMLWSPAKTVKAEARFRLDQNLRAEDRLQKRGNYYVFRWKKDLLISDESPLEVLFQYRQSSTGRSIQSKKISLHPKEKNKAEVKVIGQDYLKNGRVLSWRASLSQEGKELASEQSFMWD